MPDVEDVPLKKSRRGCWMALGVVGLIVLGAGLFYGPAIADFLKVYGVESLSEPERHRYRATSEQNLQAIYQGMLLYHDSEGQFPAADKWMDAIENRLRTNDLLKAEEKKKLIRPDLEGQANKYGYAMNDAAGGKYKDDIPDAAKTPLIYESRQDGRNAHGDPASDLDGLAITVDGTIIRPE